MTKQVPQQIQDLITRGATFVVNHSGGKDSQAMYAHIKSIVPAEQIVVIHADLQGVEWEGTQEHIRATIEHELHVTTAVDKAGNNKGFFDMVRQSGMFPTPKNRQCTSDLKRGPIDREIRHLIAAGKCNTLVVNCIGICGHESPDRAKATTFAFYPRNSKAGREIYTWLPIHAWTMDEVFATIAAAGQKPHWAYAAGMSRLSCCFCIMSKKSDMTLAAKLNPELYAQYAALEQEIGHTMQMSGKTIEEFTGVKARVYIPLKLAA